jgi:amino acid permease
MAAMCAACLAPLLSLRNLRLLAPFSAAAVGAAGAFVAAVVSLAAAAAWQGRAADFRWLPTPEMLGPTPGRAVVNLLAVLPVITMSFVCHYNLLPVVSQAAWCAAHECMHLNAPERIKNILNLPSLIFDVV